MKWFGFKFGEFNEDPFECGEMGVLGLWSVDRLRGYNVTGCGGLSQIMPVKLLTLYVQRRHGGLADFLLLFPKP